jgi:hypothetical protein
MQLSTTDFMQYLNCPKSLWLLKHEPEAFPHGEFSVFLQKLTREGYEVESYVRQYFQAEKDHAVDFQKIFETEDGLYARIDALEGTSDGKTILYEIKSSTSVKTDAAHNHIKDACFQKICAERAGQRIDRVLFRTAKIFLIRMGFNIVSRSDASDEGIAYCKSCMKARSRSLRFPLYSQAKQSRRHTSAHLWSEFVTEEPSSPHSIVPRGMWRCESVQAERGGGARPVRHPTLCDVL